MTAASKKQAKPKLTLSDNHQLECLKLLSANLSNAVIINVTLATVLCAVFWVYLPKLFLAIWFVSLLAVLFYRLRVNHQIKKVKLTHTKYIETALKKFRLGTLITGTVWGVAGITFVFVDNTDLQIFITYILGGLTAGGIMSLSVDRFSMFAFTLTTIVPHFIFLLFQNSSTQLGMAVLLFVFITFVLMTAIQQGKSLHENFRLRIRAVDDEARFRGILNVSPIAASITDMQSHEMVLCNQRYRDLIGDKGVIFANDYGNHYLIKDKDQTAIMDSLKQGKSISNKLLELEHKNAQQFSIWVLASFLEIEYREQRAVLSWFYDISDRKRMEEQIQHLAYHDSLTQLPNRSLFNDRLLQSLRSAQRHQQRIALMFVDLDGFKQVNDQFGHDTGDALLKQVAKRLSASLRESDSVSRIGGDEFILLLNDVSTQRDAEEIAEKIRHALATVFEIAGHTVNISCSIGIAVYPEHGQNEHELIKHADTAMYQAKRSGKNNVQVFQQKLNS